MRKQLAVLLLTLQVIATSCSAPTIVPNASFEVLYDGSRDEQEIVKDVELALAKNGFAVRGHQRVRPDKHMYAWYAAEPVPGRLAHFVELRYMLSANSPQRIVFVLFNDRAEVFEEREWRMFFNLRNAVIPRVFPGSTIKTVDHPSAFTATEDLDRLQAISREPLPQVDAERLRVYRSNARDGEGP